MNVFGLTRITSYILLLLLVATGLCVAQNAEKILEEASAAYEKSNGISAQFAVNISSEKQGVSESFEGSIQMRGDKFVLITPEVRTWYNGTTQWTYMSASGEVYKSTPSGDELQMINPMILFRTYKQGFNLVYGGESTSHNAKPAHDLVLTSKRGNSDITKIEIQIEKASLFPVRMTVNMKNGIRNQFRISKMQTGVNQPDSFFTFNPKDYPDVDVIDL
ncbi:MAG: hypothetical protein LBE79_10360 [Tannerella sp.]|jgi:outer membrane lipoprotein-sorting protein|nr:hypothetical protein [Tannerella sp.]